MGKECMKLVTIRLVRDERLPAVQVEVLYEFSYAVS